MGGERLESLQATVPLEDIMWTGCLLCIPVFCAVLGTAGILLILSAVSLQD